MQREVRSHRTSAPKIELRGDKQQPVAVGYAAVFFNAKDPGTQFDLGCDCFERIAPGAFNAALAEADDVRGLCNHDANWLLGRAANKTCRLSVDAIGLRYEIDLPDTQAGRDVRCMLERGDMTGSSFGFYVYGKRGKVTWSQETCDGKTCDVRTIEDCELLDVGPVTFPAYEATSAGMRAAGGADVLQERDAWRRAQQHADAAIEMDLAVRLAEAEVLRP